MTLEEAIKTALDYETRVCQIYRKAADSTLDPTGRRIFKMLGDDEQHHIKYLESRLKQWQDTGKITVEKLDSTLARINLIAAEAEKLKKPMQQPDRTDEKQMLSKALKVEIETSNFYEKMVGELTDEGRQMFARFLKIEENHINAVQTELDYISGSGYWFDFKEFDME
ncbi:MAG: ferritin family protein [Desulfobacterales bacterium]|nr:ferritin family protein [Desulfobacterales bacterium]